MKTGSINLRYRLKVPPIMLDSLLLMKKPNGSTKPERIKNSNTCG